MSIEKKLYEHPAMEITTDLQDVIIMSGTGYDSDFYDNPTEGDITI